MFYPRIQISKLSNQAKLTSSANKRFEFRYETKIADNRKSRMKN